MPLAVAHRGFSPQLHENTLAAFQAAVDLGYSYLETDIRTSADGHAMVFHDDRLDPLTDGMGTVAGTTLAELRELTVAGQPMPTLDELFAAAVERWPEARFNVDIKDRAGSALLAEAIVKHGMDDRVLVASFSDARRRACLRRYRELVGRGSERSPSGNAAPTLAQSPGMGTLADVVISLHLTGRLSRGLKRRLTGMTAFQVPMQQFGVPVVTPRFIEAAHELGIQVHVWTIDDEPTMHQLLDMGVDAIMTDRADVLARVMERRGHWPQNTVSDPVRRSAI
jgi:glycerophosphoryl diester phosphodiesterase